MFVCMAKRFSYLITIEIGKTKSVEYYVHLLDQLDGMLGGAKAGLRKRNIIQRQDNECPNLQKFYTKWKNKGYEGQISEEPTYLPDLNFSEFFSSFNFNNTFLNKL